jgi:hypothetical protein
LHECLLAIEAAKRITFNMGAWSKSSILYSPLRWLSAISCKRIVRTHMSKLQLHACRHHQAQVLSYQCFHGGQRRPQSRLALLVAGKEYFPVNDKFDECQTASWVALYLSVMLLRCNDCKMRCLRSATFGTRSSCSRWTTASFIYNTVRRHAQAICENAWGRSTRASVKRRMSRLCAMSCGREASALGMSATFKNTPPVCCVCTVKHASTAAEYAACAVTASRRTESLTALLSLGLLHAMCHVLRA